MKIKNKKKLNFLTLFLITCFTYMSIQATFNIIKIIDYKIKLVKLQALHNNALYKKNKLLSEIESFNSQKKYEEYARNYLGYAEPNEIKMILIKDNLDQSNKIHPYQYYGAYW